ncbi:MAG: prepilin-type N-terminal cleavage/methylation domain-containing protein [Pyrinomonadaceae bacterium]|nr:prepilin-type N-terminal cleavage/methylation domain-containing protein [Pyrinomonadaceae bacterium]
MHEKTENSIKIKTAESGFSIVELMVSVGIFLIFMGAIYGVLRMGTIQKTSATSQTDAIKNVRLSLNTIGRDAVNAGFGYSRVGGYAPDNILNSRLGITADADVSHDLVTAVIAGNDVNTNTLLTSGKTDVISFVFRDTDFNIGQPVKLQNSANLSGNGVSITTAPGWASYVRPYDLFLIADCCRTSLAVVTATPGGDVLHFRTGAQDPLGINLPYTGTVDTRSKLIACNPPTTVDNCMDYSNNVTAKRVFWVSYSVTSDGTLVRKTFGNNTGKPAAEQIQVQPIAYNVQNFQVKYLLRDGTVTDDPSAGGTDQPNLNNVVQIDVTITAKIEVVENGVTISNLVNLKSTFSTKNLSYDIG